MIDPADFLRVVIDPGCRFLTGIMAKDMGTPEAKVLLLAIGLQESNLEHRRQIGADGKPMPTLARGFHQFESGGGVMGVMTHSASKDAAATVCSKLHIPFDQTTVHEALAWNDYLALAFARLLLWTDAAPLPAMGDEQGAYDTYIRLWRPGKPHPEVWPQNYQLAVQTVSAAPTGALAVPFIAPKPGTLTTKTQGGVTQVDLPVMNRSWTTGSFWMSVGSGLLYALIVIGPALEPAMDQLGSSAWLAALPLGLGPIAYAIAREWYKGQRIKYAAEVAAAQARQQP